MTESKENEQRTIKVSKTKHYLYITRPDGEQRRICLKSKRFQRPPSSKCLYWTNVEHQYKFFQGFGPENLVFEDSKFAQIFHVTKKINHRCSSLSTFFFRMCENLYLEEYVQNGLKFAVSYYSPGPMRPLSKYPKEFISLAKQRDLYFYRDYDFFLKEDASLVRKTIHALSVLNISDDDFQVFFDRIDWFDFEMLVKQYGFCPKSLIAYIAEYLGPFEGIGPGQSLMLLKDYAMMARKIGRKVKKYPKYLKSMHDIMTVNYNAFKQEYDERLFSSLCKEELEHDGVKYCVRVPRQTKDVFQEGVSLNHCVSSYIPKILAEECYIFFLRLKKEPEESLVTLELREGRLVQAKGAYNRELKSDELNFLKSFCARKRIACEV